MDASHYVYNVQEASEQITTTTTTKKKQAELTETDSRAFIYTSYTKKTYMWVGWRLYIKFDYLN